MTASGRDERPSPVVERVAEKDEPVGDELVALILASIEEDELLSELVGVDLGPAAPHESHAPRGLPALADWLRRAEEVHAFLAAASARSSPSA